MSIQLVIRLADVSSPTDRTSFGMTTPLPLGCLGAAAAIDQLMGGGVCGQVVVVVG